MGLLVEGFDSPPAIFQSYNAPYYAGLLEECGYERTVEMNTYAAGTGEHSAELDQLQRRGQEIQRRYGLTTRRVSQRRFTEEMECIRTLFNESFANNDRVLPMQKDVFDFYIQELRPFVDRRLITIVERDGRPLAFTLGLPDLNRILIHLRGSLTLWGLLRLPWLRRRVREVVVLLIGALPDRATAGVGRLLNWEILRGARDGGYQTVHSTWVHEDNWTMRSIVSGWGARRTHRYALYRKGL
jgi:hypothetical protein